MGSLNKKEKLVSYNPNHESKLVQNAEVVWSRIKLEKGEVLLVKVGRHMVDYFNDIKIIVDKAFGKDATNVIVFMENDVEFEKVQL